MDICGYVCMNMCMYHVFGIRPLLVISRQWRQFGDAFGSHEGEGSVGENAMLVT